VNTNQFIENVDRNDHRSSLMEMIMDNHNILPFVNDGQPLLFNNDFKPHIGALQTI